MAAPPGTMSRRPARAGAMTTPPTRTARASPTTARIVDTAGNIGSTASQAITIDTATADGGAGDHRDCHRHRHDRRLHHQRHHADCVRHQRRAGAGEKIQVSSDGGATWHDVTQRRARAGATTTPATRTARASPTRRGWSIPPAMSAPPPARPSPSTRTPPAEALAITAIATDTGTLRRLHHQRHHADRLRHQRRAGCGREDPGQQRRRRHLARCHAEHGTSWSYDDTANPHGCELHLPGADGRYRRQYRHHRQPGHHHRHGTRRRRRWRSPRLPPTPAPSATSSPATPR